jgi:predicted Zn-dependent protease
MFSTHPATEDRIAALQRLSTEMGGRAINDIAQPSSRRPSALDPARRD